MVGPSAEEIRSPVKQMFDLDDIELGAIPGGVLGRT